MESLIPLAERFQQILCHLLVSHLEAILQALVRVHFTPFLVRDGHQWGNCLLQRSLRTCEILC